MCSNNLSKDEDDIDGNIFDNYLALNDIRMNG